MTYDHNADTAELNKFKQHAHRWWDTEGCMKPLHDINPIRLNFIHSQAILQDMNLIDIGCGGGILSESLAKAGANVTGIDMCKEMINAAKLHALEGELSINYQHTSSSETVAKGDQYDIVTCMELLEHVPDPQKLVADCAELLKHGGKAFFSTINRNLKAYAFAVVGTEYVLGMLPKGTHQYSKFIKPSELSSWCREVGLSVKATKGMSYNPFNKRYTLTDDISVNYLIYVEKEN